MCGIVGIYGKCDENTVREMMSLMLHRGPDGKGILLEHERPVVLGHRRLAIMDPPGGNQPIFTEDDSNAIVVNGEIYNFASLRSRLEHRYRFRTQSDSEAALALYAEQGPTCVSELDGMFAIALADGDDLFVARDPIGIKPLYCARKDGNLIFASEIKALINIAKDITEFPPGSWFHSQYGTQSYYEVPDYQPVVRTLEEHIVLLRKNLEQAVTKRLMSDAPLGAFLSGGLDSSIITALIRPYVNELHTFSVGTEGSRDLEAARIVSQHLDTIHHEYVLESDEVAANLPNILYHLESFDQDLVRSAIPSYFTARLASNEVKVILTGEGADELFAGYNYYTDYDDPEHLQFELHRSLCSLHNINLQRVDRMTMAHSIEGRVPFLDIKMIEFAQTIPPQLKLFRNDNSSRVVEKWVLRKAFEDILPVEILWRDKEQFDEGSGVVDLLAGVVDRWMSVEEAKRYSRHHSNVHLRSSEECLYHKLLCEAYSDPVPIIKNVARWTDRSV